jgi:hypothetical protein
MIAVFAILRVVAVAGLEPVRYPDSASYLSVDFLGGAIRLWTVPLGYRLLPGDAARVAAQVLLAVVAWGALAAFAARACRHPVVARAAALAVLLVGLLDQVTQWDLIILSESTALSLTVLGAAIALRIATPPPSRWALPALLAVLVLWAFTRHVNALALVIAFPLIAGLVLWRLPRRRALAVVAAGAVLSLWAGYAASRDNRIWLFNAYGIAAARVLPDPGATNYFVARGLPLAVFREQARRQPDHGVASHNPRIRAWIRARWKQAYASYLAEYPVHTVTEPLRAAPRLLSSDQVSLAYATPRAVLPEPVERLLGGTRVWLAALVGGSLALWLVSLRVARPRPVEIVPWTLLGLGLVWAELVWNLSADELPRLSVPEGVAVRLGALLLAAFAADRMLTER